MGTRYLPAMHRSVCSCILLFELIRINQRHVPEGCKTAACGPCGLLHKTVFPGLS